MDKIKHILNSDNSREIRALFSFDSSDSHEILVKKFNLFARYFFVRFFPHKDAPFHREMDTFNAQIYKGELNDFLNICFRGAAKTTRTKLFVAFCIANDIHHTKKYIKILSKDHKNSTQFVTDIYNMLVNPRVSALYPEIFAKTVNKREETMSSFTTAQGVKITAGTVGQSQRGNIQDESRPDLIILDDFEDRATLRSAVTTQAIFDNCEEARTGLSKRGGIIYLGNYLSERGNVHKLVKRIENQMIIPIKKDGKPTWDAYTIEEINNIEKNADDFHGEYMCEPSAGFDIMFDRASIKRQERKEPWRVIADFKIFHQYDPSHRYASGHDVAGGVGLDSSASVFWDFSTTPSRVVATFKSNTIKPDTFGDEIESEANRFGRPLVAVENNKFDMCIGRLKHLGYDNMYFQEMKASKVGIPPKTKTLGWNTNADTKPKMIFALKKAVEDGHVELSDPDLIDEFTSYTRDDLMDGEIDPRLSTRHFDLLMACAIGYQMKDYATFSKENEEGYQQGSYESPLLDD